MTTNLYEVTQDGAKEGNEMTTTITGYHFLRDDMRSGEGATNRKPWIVGQTRRERGVIIPCKNGYHASPTAFDALKYAPGPILCLVELSGDVTPHGAPVDKFVTGSRTLIKAVDISRELRLFACECAERVLSIFETQCPGDLRPRHAIETARRFADGDATAQELAVVRADAWAATRAAWTAVAGAASSGAAAAAAAAAEAAWAATRAALAAAWAAAAAAAAAAADAAAEVAWQRSRFNAICEEALR